MNEGTKETGIGIISKLRIMMLVMAALAIVFGGYLGYFLYNSSEDYYRIYNEDAVAANQASALAKNVSESRAAITSLALSTDPTVKSQAVANTAALDKNIDTLMDEVESRAVSAEGKRVMSQLRAKLTAYRQAREAVLSVNVPRGQSIDATPQMAAMRQSGDDLVAMIDSVADIANKAAATEMSQAYAKTLHVITISAAIIVVVTLLVLIAVIKETNEIGWRLRKLCDEAADIASGNLTNPIYVKNSDEIGLVAQSFEKMRRSMNSVMMEIHLAADQVAAGAKNVSDASVSLSQGAAEQASSVEELSSSISEISSQTSSNAENAGRANELTQKAREQAQAGDRDMQSMLSAMEDINVSSTNISKIIKVIDEIAFQTNILALNAAVEAARAGQHGKGFAVVAEEVRNLAARSAKAAKETTDMIEDSIEKVNAGRNIAGKTAEALQSITSDVDDVARLVDEIAKASKEQKLALEQIDQGVLQVSQVVQGNSATSEQSASASEELSAQASRLKETAERFSLEGGRVAAAQYTSDRKDSARPSAKATRDASFEAPRHSEAAAPEGDVTDFGKY